MDTVFKYHKDDPIVL